MNAPLLEIESLQCRLADGNILFDGVSLELRPAGAVLIEGGSGQGKSSLLFHLRGLSTPERTYSGTIKYMGEDIAPQHHSRIGLVLQNPHSQMLSTLVREELCSSCDMADTAPEDTAIRIGTTVEILGLDHLLNVPTRHLSTGQKHLVAIGTIGIIGNPLILLDEPFLYLDRQNINRVFRYIDYLRENGSGVTVSSHPGSVPSDRFDKVVKIPSKNTVFVNKDISFQSEPLQRRDNSIRVIDADIGYDSERPVLKGMSFSIATGEELWIFGENGTGKTTLLKALAGELHPCSGSIITGSDGHRPKTYLIPQNPDRFFFESSILQELVSPMLFNNGVTAHYSEMRAAASQLLETVGLQGKQDLSPWQLSFGERIRLAAAQAALLQPDFLLLDDILAFLDLGEQEFLVRFLREMKTHFGCGLVFANSQRMPHVEGEQPLLFLQPYNCTNASNPEPVVAPRVAPGNDSFHLPPKARAKRRKRGLFGRLLKQSPFQYVPGDSLVHSLHPLVKLAIGVLLWLCIMIAGPIWFPLISLVELAYYILARLRLKHFLNDARYFVVQGILFTLLLPILQWDIAGAPKGALCAARVWLFCLPIVVMMRTTTLDQWIASAKRLLSRQKRIVLGISLGLLPCIVAEIAEVLHVQKLKGFTLHGRDLFKPVRLWHYVRSLLVPIVIMIEDMALLAEISVRLRGYED